ncbi:MAG: competence/damage-inducible protein A [Methylococcaceae bacterium]
MNPTLEIFSQGEEIVTGQIADTNAAWLSQQGVQLGFTVTRHTAVGDKLDDLVELLREIAGRADCCICTGGLGPTSDDLTAEAVAKAFDLPLEFDEIAFEQIKQFFSNRKRAMPESNRKQAMLPKGAQRLDNDLGTAPGFAVQAGRCWFAFIPGVPPEMRHLFTDRILPSLSTRFTLRPDKLITIKTIGIGESALQEQINDIDIPTAVQLGFRASVSEVQIKLLFPHDYPDTAIASLTSSITAQLGDNVFAIDSPEKNSGDLVAVIDKLMLNGKHTLAVIETASYGLLGSLCVGSDWLLSAVYQQSIVKSLQHLDAEADIDQLTGAAKALAADLQKTSCADLVLIQLFAGNHNNLHDNNKSIVLYLTLLIGDQFLHASHSLTGPIKRKQHQAALLSLDLLRRYLQQK